MMWERNDGAVTEKTRLHRGGGQRVATPANDAAAACKYHELVEDATDTFRAGQGVLSWYDEEGGGCGGGGRKEL